MEASSTTRRQRKKYQWRRKKEGGGSSDTADASIERKGSDMGSRRKLLKKSVVGHKAKVGRRKQKRKE